MFIDAWFKTEDSIIQDALFTAALITYRRCFTTGVREQLDASELNVIGEGAEEFHRYLCDQASKLSAHPVNAFEQVKIGVVIQGEEIAGIGHMIGRMMSFQSEGFRQWRSFVDHLSKNVLEPKLEKAKEAALQSARALPIADIASVPTVRITIPGQSQAGRRRQ